jgi:adenylate kinase family enzyme
MASGRVGVPRSARRVMERVAVIGNSGGGKSTLARRLASLLRRPCVEVDALLWQPGWRLTPAETYEAEHARLIARERWIIDGLGRRESIPQRLSRASAIVLIDMPLWMHFWLAAERQLQWASGELDHPPAGVAQMPRTEALFRTIWEVDQTWMPEIRRLVALEEARGKSVWRLASVSDLENFSLPDPGNSH